MLACRHTGGVEIRLDGGNADGAVRVGDTVRRAAGPWTPAVHARLAHLAGKGFAGSPRPLGLDSQGREVLTFLVGETVGYTRPWPGWVHAAGHPDAGRQMDAQLPSRSRGLRPAVGRGVADGRAVGAGADRGAQ